MRSAKRQRYSWGSFFYGIGSKRYDPTPGWALTDVGSLTQSQPHLWVDFFPILFLLSIRCQLLQIVSCKVNGGVKLKRQLIVPDRLLLVSHIAIVGCNIGVVDG